MADDRLEWFEAALGAVSKVNSDDDDLHDARCPKCEASSFVRVSDLYAASVGRLEEQPDSSRVVREGGLTDLQIVAKLRPPRQKSAVGFTLAVAIPLSVVAFVLYRRFGELVGQISLVVDLVVAAVIFMTTLRRLSDRYYHSRQRWNRMFMCRRCGQLVAS